jgi:hypothetical protein
MDIGEFDFQDKNYRPDNNLSAVTVNTDIVEED